VKQAQNRSKSKYTAGARFSLSVKQEQKRSVVKVKVDKTTRALLINYSKYKPKQKSPQQNFK